jgi:lysophospholipase L1-like esterase
MQRLVRTLRFTGKLALAATATLVMLELALRLFAPVDRLSYIPNTYDPQIGIRQIPSARGFIRCPEYAIDLIINDHGLRDRDYPYAKPSGTRRILCLGDSFTNGFGVAATETFAKQLEAALAGAAPDSGARGAPRWQVLNAGVAATGTAHQLAWFEHEGFRYAPDIVLLTVSPNDFADNASSGLYSLDANGRLTAHPAPRSRALKLLRLSRHLPGYVSILSHTQLLNAAKELFARRYHARRIAAGRGGLSAAEAFPAQLRLTMALIERLAVAAAARGAQLAVMLVPPLPGAPPAEREMELLAAALRDGGYALIDPRPRFAELTRRGVETNYPVDGHWTAAGHAAAAAAILGWLREEAGRPSAALSR